MRRLDLRLSRLIEVGVGRLIRNGCTTCFAALGHKFRASGLVFLEGMDLLLLMVFDIRIL